ncbi:unnamed protein product [Schistosoma mattheei]|uniref:Uncharacterized protein n=1 Tax=Schistosoma mattheei TaxID=31246 RepID=A0A183Q6E9_9TREM|nr:unnamed protein product [Schistosoma mattheei]
MTDTRHVKGESNYIAGALSRIQVTAVTSPVLDLPSMAAAQANDPFCAFLQCREVLLVTTSGNSLCDVSTGLPRPTIPSAYHRLVFGALYGLSHPGIAATLRLIAAQCLWPSMNKDVHLVRKPL